MAIMSTIVGDTHNGTGPVEDAPSLAAQRSSPLVDVSSDVEADGHGGSDDAAAPEGSPPVGGDEGTAPPLIGLPLNRKGDAMDLKG